MCGLAGYSLSGSELPVGGYTEFAKSALAHRGPDDSGFFQTTDYLVGLVHTRLAILDISPLGHQPMLSDDGRVALVFNGEIYNFREIRSELEAQGHEFCGRSDTEVILRLYLQHKEALGRGSCGLSNMLRRLNGIFAFALWDADRDSLLLVRDGFGVKPLYYQAYGSNFYFASEIKALPSLPEALDIEALDRYLSFLWCPGNGTPSPEVRKLGPGEAMWVTQGAVRERLIWYRLPTFCRKRARKSQQLSMPKRAAIRGTEDNLRQAVYRQMVADVPLGAFLSGGLDSSSVVAFAREQNPDIRCFTIEAAGLGEDQNSDDLPYARRVAAHLKVPLEVVRIDASQMAHDLPAMVAQLDEPLADPAALNVLYISRLAREQGIKVLLSGAGGDDLFTGYRRHVALNYEGLWSWLPSSFRGGLERVTSGLNQHQSASRRFRKLFSGASLDGDARLVNYFRWIDRQDLRALYTPGFRAELGDARAEEPLLEFLAEMPADASRLDRMLALEQRFFLTDHNLTYTDKMSMSAGVEVRVPFLDLDLVKFASFIPDKYKQRGRQGKWVLKKAMEPYLPRDVIYRPKAGFGAPLRRWLRVDLREWLADTLSVERLQRRGLFDPSAVQRLINANAEGRVDAAYTLLSLACIELWCQQFIDRRGNADVNAK